MGESSTQNSKKFRGQSPHSSPIKTTSLLNSIIPKTVKLDFPRCDGKDDPTTWVCRAEKYFSLHEIAESDKLTLASFYLEGNAQLWFQMLEQEMLYIT